MGTIGFVNGRPNIVGANGSIEIASDNSFKINGAERTFGIFNSYNLISGNLALGGAVDTFGMATTLYTGNGTGQSIVITDGVNKYLDLAGQWGNSATETFGGLVWLKSRSAIDDNKLFDSVRGTGVVNSNLTNAEATVGTIGLTTTGFTPTGLANTNAVTYASWVFQTTHRTSGVTNHGKAYTCHYNPFTGFTIVKYEGSGLAGHEIPHHLGRKLGFVTTKNLSSIVNWNVQTDTLINSGQYLKLNLTDAQASFTNLITTNTDTLCSLGTDAYVNTSANQYIMYGWANSYFDESNTLIGNYEVGIYQGTGAVGNKVTTRGKPAWVMIKSLSATGNWRVIDNLRGLNCLYPNLSSAETAAGSILFVSDGVVINETSSDYNTASGQYLYMVVYDNDSGSGKSKYPRATDSSTLTLNAKVPFAKGKDNAGVINAILAKNEVVSGFTLQQGKNYVYANDNGTYGVSYHRPRYMDNDLVRGYAGESPAVYKPNENQWYSSNAGTELISNGTFNTDTTGWIAGAAATLSQSSGNMRITITNSGSAERYAYRVMATEVGKKYTIKVKVTVESGTATASYIRIGTGTTGNLMDILNSGAKPVGSYEYSFVAQGTSTVLTLLYDAGTNGHYSQVDDITCYETVIVPSTPITESRNYLDAVVYADAGGQPTYVEQLPKTTYFDEVKANEFKGKNACTAYVYFDGTTTPPTIFDSYNVSSVIRATTGEYHIYFTNPMDNILYTAVGQNYSGSGTSGIQRHVGMSKTQQFTNKMVISTGYVDPTSFAAENAVASVQIFGGKNA